MDDHRTTPAAAPAAVLLPVPVGVDLVHAPLYARPDLCALVLGNDFKMRAHLVCYVPTATAPASRSEITDLGQLADSAVRDAAATMLRLWQSRPAAGRDGVWVDAVDAFNDTSSGTVIGPYCAALRVLERLAGCNGLHITRAPADGYAPSLELTGGARLLLAVERWLGLGARPTPRTVQVDIDPDTRIVTVRVFAEAVGDFLAWARRACGAGVRRGGIARQE